MQQRQRLSSEIMHSLLRCFASDIEASKASKITLLNRNTVNKCYKLLRQEIYSNYERNFYLKGTTCEIDESYFGPRRFRGSNGKLTVTKKIIVFGIIERNGSVFTEIIPSIKTRTLFKIIKKTHFSNNYNFLR